MLTEWLKTLDDDAREFFEERAAILEFDGGLSRSDAECEAQKLTERYLLNRRFYVYQKVD